MTTLTTLHKTLSNWGFNVVRHGIKGRPYKFDCIGVMGHHTAGPNLTSLKTRTPSLNTIIKGRPGIPGPLSQLYLGYDALDDLKANRKPTIHLVSTGRANHAGTGGPWRTVPKNSGNAYLCGIEIENVGNNQLFHELLILHRLCAAAVLDHINRDSSWYLCHKTWTSRKPDIAAVNVGTERAAIQSLLNSGPLATRKSLLQEDEVDPTDWSNDGRKIVQDLVTKGTLHTDVVPGKAKLSLGNVINDMRNDINRIESKLDQLYLLLKHLDAKPPQTN